MSCEDAKGRPAVLSLSVKLIPMVASQSLLGIGLYTPTEAALYARLRPEVVHRWFFGSTERPPVFRPQIVFEKRKIISFLDFIQTLAIRSIRNTYGVSLGKIRQALVTAKENLGIEYPFARQHKTFLLGKEIVLQMDDGRLVEASGRHRTNQLMKPIVEIYLQDLDFGLDGFAENYRAFKWNDRSCVQVGGKWSNSWDF